jgi:hypothetical protein
MAPTVQRWFIWDNMYHTGTGPFFFILDPSIDDLSLIHSQIRNFAVIFPRDRLSRSAGSSPAHTTVSCNVATILWAAVLTNVAAIRDNSVDGSFGGSQGTERSLSPEFNHAHSESESAYFSRIYHSFIYSLFSVTLSRPDRTAIKSNCAQYTHNNKIGQRKRQRVYFRPRPTL